MGHVHRCLTLADELSQHAVSFWATGDNVVDELIRARGYPIITLGQDAPVGGVTVWDYLDDVDVTDVLADQAVGTRVVVIECQNRPAVAAADLAVNALYDAQTGFTSVGALVGPGWEPLRAEFHTPAGIEPTEGRRLRVLVTFGGTDPAELSGRFAELCMMTGYGDEKFCPEVRLLWPPGRPELDDPEWGDLLWSGAVSEAMTWADVVVCSAGRTVLEVAAIRRPAIVVTSHEREEHHARLPGMVWLGHHAGLTDAVFQSNLRWLLDHPDERDTRAARAHAAVDPAGATLRLADMIDRLARG